MLSEAAIVVGLVRLASALPVLRWPWAGALLAIAVDLADLALFSYLGRGWPPDYQAFDKAADLACMTTFLIVALRWGRPERPIAVGLFGLRMVGVAAFELTAMRPVLMAFPNVFELWFVFVTTRDRFMPGLTLTRTRALTSLAVLTALKLSQEWLLHVDRRLDGYALVDVVGRIH
jgi:hypothetical protein